MFTSIRPVFSRLVWLLAALPCLLAAQTTVILSTSPNPSKFGAPVILTATVTPASSTGKVTFYDGVTVLGTQSLVSGVAQMPTIALPSGSRMLRAYYAGATSNVITQIVQAQPGVGFAITRLTAAESVSAVADFNGDGKADLATLFYNGSTNNITVWLGDGAGNFTPVTAPVSGFFSGIGAAADFNGDGKMDLALLSSNTLGILLGNGDGTFQPVPTYPLSLALSLTVGDFNGDGIADLALADPDIGVNILLGKGDGTFQPAVPYPTNPQNTFYQAAFVVAGDFNGDGKADLAVANLFTASLSIVLGNGDGTFQAPSLLAIPNPAVSLATGDFNGDGKADLATSNGDVLLGNGDGTFRQPANYSVGTNPWVTVGDFNGDGNTDLVYSPYNPGNISVLFGKGDGTFQAPVAYPYTTSGSPIVVADFNSDGKADLALVNGTGIVLLGTSVTVTPTGGSLQSTPTGAPFPAPLQVTVKDGANPLSGVTVIFTVPSSDVSAVLSSNTAVTDANGVASVTATAKAVGQYQVFAEALGVYTFFALTNLVSGTPSIQATSGTPQQTPLGTAFPMPLQVALAYPSGSPAAGVSVTFSAPASGASAVLSSAMVVSNAFGIASVTATANNIVGSYSVNASVGSISTSFSLTNLPAGNSNLAQGKAATQSSTFPGYAAAAASSAADGNTDGNFFDGSVTATNLDANPWWQVDLGASAAVSSIVIWNRTDCCASRLSDYWVFVSDTPFLASDTPATLMNRTGTFASHRTTAPSPSTTIAAAAEGRYVRVQLSSAGYLSLAEVQVFGSGGTPPPSNLAQGRPATQSSTFPGYASTGAGSAVDGNTDGNFSDGSVTATNADPNAWWQVDLGAPASVSSITIWNRTDCCSGRLSDYWVFVSNTPFLPTDSPANLQNRAGTFASHQTAAPNPLTTITVNAQGQYVRVQLSDTDYLSLAEVQVFGTGGSPISNLAVGKTASQSSTLPGYATDGAPVAVDGNTDGNFFDGSVTATGLDSNPWWQVDLGSPATVSSIAIWNRTDCCGSRLSDYWVFVSNTPFLATDTPATLMNRAGTFASHQTTSPNPSITIPVGAQGQYVRVQLSSAGYLSLAEVQVFGQ